MRSWMVAAVWVLAVGLAVGGLAALVSSQLGAVEVEKVDPWDRPAVLAEYQKGNFKDAYDALRERLLSERDNSSVVDDLRLASNCLTRLRRVNELDPLWEGVVQQRGDNWRALAEVARLYFSANHRGYLLGGEPVRGYKRGGRVTVVHLLERDRIRALQLMLDARSKSAGANKVELGEFYEQYAKILRGRRGKSWSLQVLTDLAKLPAPEPGWGYRAERPAPIRADGTPIWYAQPETYEAATSDGERWRWALAEAGRLDAARAARLQMVYANFLFEQFGVQTLAYLQEYAGEAGSDAVTGAFEVHTLSETETIARLANGVKRIQLPTEHNFIAIYRAITEQRRDRVARETAYGRLAAIFTNRRQLPKAAATLDEAIRLFGRGKDGSREDQLASIRGNWGRFLPGMTQVAGRPPVFEFRYRNGPLVAFKARKVRQRKLLADVEAYLRTKPDALEWKRMNVDNVGYRLLQEGGDEYLGDVVAEWEVKLDPRPEHGDRTVSVEAPLEAAGIYWVEAQMKDGNRCFCAIWVHDTVLISKQLEKAVLYYVVDAASGTPIADAKVDLFGYRQVHKQGRTYNTEISSRSRTTDANGQLIVDDVDANFTWLVTATTSQGRLASLGFSSIWLRERNSIDGERVHLYSVTDRPIYRPQDSLRYKIWLRRVNVTTSDDPEVGSRFAGETVRVRIQDPQGDVVFNETRVANEFGGVDGAFVLPKDWKLGRYSIHVEQHGYAGMFRVEEYRKPEYEVTVTSSEKPVQLGDSVEISVGAQYFHGAPVTQAKVTYTVQRTFAKDDWYPPRRWDWLYRTGYAWRGTNCDWHPGFRNWGKSRPAPYWSPSHSGPPELVAEGDAQLDANGEFRITIDTAAAKKLYGDRSHRYAIQATVVDASRRTIVGNGSFLVAEEPFELYAWMDRGFLRVGDRTIARAKATTLDGRGVAATGRARLLKLTYPNDSIEETQIQEWPIVANSDGDTEVEFIPQTPGQYRMSFELTDATGNAREGAFVFTVRDASFSGKGLRFNPLELVADKAEYAPGDALELAINTERENSTVLLFVRPVGGLYPRPQTLRLDGKSRLSGIDVKPTDQPNFFVEALTVSDGRVYQELIEIVVPPADRALQMTLTPAAAEVKPGQSTTVDIELKDSKGRPFVGDTVVAIYDRAVEAISGGSNVPPILKSFWEYRRSHSPSHQSNLNHHSANLGIPHERQMEDLGVFGGQDFDVRTRGRLSETKSIPFGSAGAPRSGAIEMSDGAFDQEDGDEDGGGHEELVQPDLRSDFVDTALWVGSIRTDAAGKATVSVDFPDNVTSWKVRAWSLGHGTRVGEATAEIVARKNLLLRLQAPRFFVENDEVILSAVVHNYLDETKRTHVTLDVGSSPVEIFMHADHWVEIEPNGEARVDWRVRVNGPGEVKLRMEALTDVESDAVEMLFPSHLYGAPWQESFSGTLRRDESSGSLTFTVPEERRVDQTRLEVRYSPTLAGAIVDALPYLAAYPYGCTEQTLNRFLPAVLARGVLDDLGLDLAEIGAFRANLNAQEMGSRSDRVAGWARVTGVEPVFDREKLDDIVRSGVTRLVEMQLSDGGWGWFSGWGERSYPHTTALVVRGLERARKQGVAIPDSVLARGYSWLSAYQENQLRRLVLPSDHREFKSQTDHLDAWAAFVLAEGGQEASRMLEYLLRDRNRMSPYGLGLIGLVCHLTGQMKERDLVIENISQFEVNDDSNQTLHLRLPGSGWWYWYGSEFETQACYLKLLTLTNPHGEKAARVVKYLLNNRKHATVWHSTRDTAFCVEAFVDYLKATDELEPHYDLEIVLDGRVVQTVEIRKDNLFRFKDRVILEGAALTGGEHQLEFRKKGKGPLYFAAYVSTFNREKEIPAAGLELKVERKVYRLHREDRSSATPGAGGRPVARAEIAYRREELSPGATVESGTLLEVELSIESKNDYEYLLFEDFKAAGWEPVEALSGYNGNALGAYIEFRDRQVAFFVRQMARGKYSVSYRLRAETPGLFHAMPAQASALYAPELRGNSVNTIMRIEDAR